MSEAENQINDLEHKEAKINHEEQEEEESIPTNENYKQPLGQLQIFQH